MALFQQVSTATILHSLSMPSYSTRVPAIGQLRWVRSAPDHGRHRRRRAKAEESEEIVVGRKGLYHTPMLQLDDCISRSNYI
jgi:hypothetical protein